MSRKPDRSGTQNGKPGLHLVVVARDPTSEPCGIRRSPPHLPDEVRRLPGESVHDLVRRAKALAVGEGLAVAFLDYGEALH